MFRRSNNIVTGLLVLCFVALVACIACDIDSPPSSKNTNRAVLDATQFSTPPGIRLLYSVRPNALTKQALLHAEKFLEADKGGRVNLSDGSIELTVPPGALSEDALITLDSPTSDVMEVECGPDGIQFNVPVDLTISYADVDLMGIDESSLVVLWLNPEANRWEAQSSTVDVAGKRVTSGLNHFSRYSLGGGASAKADKGRNLEKSIAQLEAGLSTQPNTLALKHLVQATKQSLRDMNPDIYRTVELGLEIDQKFVESGDEVVLQELVKNIDIHVYSNSWDAMEPQEKVDLINTTFSFLKRRYPKITPFVNLKFDDKRQDLNLKSLSVGI